MCTIEEKYYVTDNRKITKVQALIKDGAIIGVADWDEAENRFSKTFHDSSYYYTELMFDSEDNAKAYLGMVTPSQEEIDKVMKHFYADEDAFEKAMKEHYENCLPDFILKQFRNPDNFLPSETLTMAIRQLLQEGILNIDGLTFHKSKVNCVKWGPDNDTNHCGYSDEEGERPIQIILENGMLAYPRTKEERWLVRLVFGMNAISNREWPNLKIPE